MERVKYFPITITTGTTLTSMTYLGRHDQLVFHLPNYTNVFGGNTTVTVRSTPNPSVATAATCYYFDYGSATNKQCQVTITVAGNLELPYGGGFGYVQLQFSSATTGATTAYLVTPMSEY